MGADPNVVSNLDIQKALRSLPYGLSGRPFFVSNSTVPVLNGRVGADFSGNGLSPLQPFATLAFAVTKVVAGRGDVIFLMPGHSETVTAATSVAKAGTQIVGLQLANKLPKLIVNGAVDCLSLDAANCSIENVDFGIVTTDAPTSLINVTAAACAIRNCTMIPSAGSSVNVVDCITLAAGADDVLIDGVRIANTLTAVNSFISIEAAIARAVIRNNIMRGDLVTAGVIDGATATQLMFYNNMIVTIGTNIPAVILDSNPTGMAWRNHVYGTDATIANDAQWGSALLVGENFTRGGTGSAVSASNIIPALDT